MLFKSIRLQDATPTFVSAYGDHGIELSLRDNYYALPKRELSHEESISRANPTLEKIEEQAELYEILYIEA